MAVTGNRPVCLQTLSACPQTLVGDLSRPVQPLDKHPVRLNELKLGVCWQHSGCKSLSALGDDRLGGGCRVMQADSQSENLTNVVVRINVVREGSYCNVDLSAL